MNGLQLAGLVLGSGGLSGLASAAVTLWVARGDREHRTSERREIEAHEERLKRAEAEHASKLRREEAHDRARADFVPLADGVARWIESLAEQAYNDDIGDRAPIKSHLDEPDGLVEAVDHLRRIRAEHPTTRVRSAASGLIAKLDAAYADIPSIEDPNGPSLDRIRGWLEDSRALVEMIHADEGRA